MIGGKGIADMAKKTDEYVKYIAERVVTYIDTPRDVRKQERARRRPYEPWQSRWFGMIPFALGMWVSKLRSKKVSLHGRTAAGDSEQG